MRVAVFGLGEAGSSIAEELAERGAEVHGYDPADVPTPPGVNRHSDPSAAVEGVELTLAITAAADARVAMDQAWEEVARGSLYADMATASPVLEAELAKKAAAGGVAFADVALMAPVPGRGLATPALASGSGAAELVRLLNPLAANISAIGDVAGLASERKLLRSVVSKGLAALLVEAHEAADAHGDGEWVRGHLVDFLTSLDETMIDRLSSGTIRHARRRLEEMETVSDLLTAVGVEPHMTRATAQRLRGVAES